MQRQLSILPEHDGMQVSSRKAVLCHLHGGRARSALSSLPCVLDKVPSLQNFYLFALSQAPRLSRIASHAKGILPG